MKPFFRDVHGYRMGFYIGEFDEELDNYPKGLVLDEAHDPADPAFQETLKECYRRLDTLKQCHDLFIVAYNFTADPDRLADLDRGVLLAFIEKANWLDEQRDWEFQDELRSIVDSAVIHAWNAVQFKDHAEPELPTNPGFVYLLQSPTSAYKIGRTKNPENRLKTFEVKLPFEVEFVCLIKTPHMSVLESQLHARFADKRVNGEWFDLLPEDVEYIKSLAK